MGDELTPKDVWETATEVWKPTVDEENGGWILVEQNDEHGLWENQCVLEGSNDIQKARETMRNAFDADEGYRISYISNIAMLLHDRYGIIDYKIRNEAAEAILKLIFYS